jgi:WD40 repeat protein
MVSAAAVSPDGTHLVLGTRNGDLFMFRFEPLNSEGVSMVSGQGSFDLALFARTAVFSPDGQWLAVTDTPGSDPTTVSLLHYVDGSWSFIKSVPGPMDYAQLEISRDGKVLAAVGYGTFFRWHTASGELIGKTKAFDDFKGWSSFVPGTDGRLAWVSVDEKPAKVFDVVRGRYKAVGWVNDADNQLVFKRGGRWKCAVFASKSYRIVDILSGTVERKVSASGLADGDVKVSDRGKWIGARSADRSSLTVCSLETGQKQCVIKPDGGISQEWRFIGVNGVADLDDRLTIWDARTGAMRLAVLPVLDPGPVAYVPGR